MRIGDFSSFIALYPTANQAFTAKKKVWEKIPLPMVSELFGAKESISICRGELYQPDYSIQTFILKTLVWGYPTLGRGNNILVLLEANNFKRLTNLLESYSETGLVTSEKYFEDIKRFEGLGLSTMSKFTHFLGTEIDGTESLILDNKIIRAITGGHFEEFHDFKGLSERMAKQRYVDYLVRMNTISEDLGIEPRQIEIFLFQMGLNLKPTPADRFQDKMNSGEPDKFIVLSRREDSYQDCLMKTIEVMKESREDLFTALINLAVRNEYSEIDNAFDIGDGFRFELAHFSESKDLNVKHLYTVISKLDDARGSIANFIDLE